MPGDDSDHGWIDLSEALEALRTALTTAWWDGQASRIRFKLEPVELTVQAGVTRVGKGAAGIKWHLLSLGGERSKETVATQTIKLRLAPVLFDAGGKQLPDAEQLVADDDRKAGESPGESASHEPE
jgi:hypothetical protein